MNQDASKSFIEPMGNYISILKERSAPYTLKEIEDVISQMEENSHEETSLMFNPDTKVIVNYSIPDPVTGGQVVKSGDLSFDFTNAINLALNIKRTRPDNIHYIPHESVMDNSLSISELAYFLRTNSRFDKSIEALHINHLSPVLNGQPRHVGVVVGLGYIRIHHSNSHQGVFLLEMKLQESPWV